MKLTRMLSVFAVLTLMLALAGTAQAKTESLNIQAGMEIAVPIDLRVEDHVMIEFSAVGEAPTTMHFWVTFADGKVADYGEVSQKELSFVSESSGQFVMHFDNSAYSSSKLVTLNYEVEHYFFGMPGLLFILVAIAVLLVGIVAGYIIMGKYS